MMNIPALRFPGFVGEWEEKSIGDILTIGSGKDYKHLEDGEIPVYGTGGYMTSVNDYLYDGESVCIGRKGTIDKPVLISGKFWTVDTLFYTHSFVNTMPKFVLPLFKKINWKKYNEASGVPSLSKATIEKININLPPLPEQQKIASFLSAVDAKIAQLLQKGVLLGEYKRGVMQGIFMNKNSVENEKLRVESEGCADNSQLSTFHSPLRFRADDGSLFGDWVERRLGEMYKLQGGFAFKSSNFKTSGIPIIRISNISNNNYIDKRNIVYYNEIENDINYRIEKGNLLVAMSGATTGKSSIYNLDEKAYLNQRVGLFRTQKDKIYYEFLIQFVFSELFIKQLDAVLVAGAQPNISSKDIENFKINLPSLPEQTKIANFLSAIDTKIAQNTQSLEKMKTFKRGLLQGMFI